MQKLLIVDGSNLLFQMFYGMPARIVNRQGKPIHGTIGFVGALLKTVRRFSPSHVVVLFDGECYNARKDLDSEYKANRPDFSQMSEEETPFSQMPDIDKALDFLGIKHAEPTCCETDDVIAAYALKYGKETSIVISSFDSDFFQLISDNVTVFRYRGDKSILCDCAYVQPRFGVPPHVYADYKSLVGDTADNIKGAQNVGPKTAAVLVNEYGSLQAVLDGAESISRERIRESVISARERLQNNYRLIKLDDCAKIPFELEELRFTYSGISTGEVLNYIGIK